MARKSITDLRSAPGLTTKAIEHIQSVSEVKYELAKEAYDEQDRATQAVIDKMVDTLRTYCTGYINVQLQPPTGALVPVKLTNEYLGYNLLFLAVEIVKDLALLDIKVASFKFPKSMCAVCGAELGIPELTKAVRR
jgi:hypothetical protein